MIKTNQDLSSSNRDLNYTRIFTILANNNVRKFSQPDKKYSLSGRPFTIFLEELTAGRRFSYERTYKS